jgi:dienelactone hydrolase
MRWPVFLLLLSSCAFAYSETAPHKDVDIVSADGTKLRATLYPAQHPGPAVLLLHMCNTTRKSWQPVASLLSSGGISALTIDNRGFGESGGPRYEGASPQVVAQIEKSWLADFDAAYQYLSSQPGIDNSRIGVAGGSCGVNNAIGVAERHSSVKALVLLAGGTDLNGLDFLVQHPWIPLFTAAASDDEYIHGAPELMRWFSEVTENPRNQFVGFKDGRHGTEIFGPHPELEREIVAFFQETLVKSPVDPNAPFTPRRTQAAEFWKLAEHRGDAKRAEEMFEAVHQRDRNAVVFPEYMMNLLGYDRLQKGDPGEGLILLKLNTEAYPESANTWDSLSDAYIANGKTDLALSTEERCLQVLPTDPAPNAQFKTELRKAAEQKIERLKSEKR